MAIKCICANIFIGFSSWNVRARENERKREWEQERPWDSWKWVWTERRRSHSRRTEGTWTRPRHRVRARLARAKVPLWILIDIEQKKQFIKCKQINFFCLNLQKILDDIQFFCINFATKTPKKAHDKNCCFLNEKKINKKICKILDICKKV